MMNIRTRCAKKSACWQKRSRMIRLSLLAWGIGNEIELGNANIAAAWNFVEELAQLIKSIDKRHLVSTVISYNPSALDSVAKYAPSLDYVGINVYGPMGEVQAAC